MLLICCLYSGNAKRVQSAHHDSIVSKSEGWVFRSKARVVVSCEWTAHRNVLIVFISIRHLLRVEFSGNGLVHLHLVLRQLKVLCSSFLLSPLFLHNFSFCFLSLPLLLLKPLYFIFVPLNSVSQLDDHIFVQHWSPNHVILGSGSHFYPLKSLGSVLDGACPDQHNAEKESPYDKSILEHFVELLILLLFILCQFFMVVDTVFNFFFLFKAYLVLGWFGDISKWLIY